MAGKLWLAGFNGYGQLGDNSVTNVSSPIQTITGGSNWSYVSKSFASNTAALKSDGTLWLWGQGTRGVLGNNSTSDRSSPVQTITGGTNWAALSLGNYAAFGIKKDGTLWSWGANDYGKLGHNDLNDKSSPVQIVTGGTDWASVSNGAGHAAAIKTDGTLWMIGQNTFGQLGTNSTTDVSSPVQTVAGGTNWSSVSCGWEMTAAIKKDGTLWCWGNNGYGQLGNNSTTNVSSPVQTVTGGTSWTQVSAGMATGALKADGTLWIWGKNNTGMLGDNTTINKSSPIQTVAGGTNWSYVSTNLYGSGGVKKDGTMWRWGANYAGEIGDETLSPKSSPVQTVATSLNWTSVEVGTTELRGLDQIPLFLSVATPPSYIYSAKIFGIQPIINIVDGSSVVQTGSTDAVTVAVVSGNATLSGTTTVNAVAGVVTYTNLSLTGYGLVTLQFTATGLTSTSVTINVEIAGAILPKRSETAASVPTSGQLLVGELAINIADKKGYVKKSDGTIVNVFTGLASGSITSGFVGNAAILSGNIGSGQIGFYHLASGAAGSTLSSGIVTSGYLGDNAVVSGSIGSGQIGIVHLASGTLSTATLGSGQVTSGSIASGSVSQFKLSSGAVNSGHINDNAVVTSSIASGQVTGSKIAASTIANANLVNSTITIAGSSTALGGSWSAAALNTASGLTGGPYYPSGSLTIGIATAGVVSGMIGSGQVGFVHLASGTISTATLGSGQVTSGVIASGSIGQFHHASGSITSGHIGNNAVVSGSIASGSIGTFHISSGSITTNLIASGTIVSEDLADNIIVSGKVISGSIAWLNLSSGAVRSGHVGDAAVQSGNIASGQIGWSAHASGAVRSGHIGDGAVVSGSVASGQIGAFHLASGVISTAVLGSGQVASGSIASGTVNNFALSSGAVLSGHIGNNAVVSGSIASGSVGQFAIASGVITAEHIASGAVIPADIADNAVISGKIASGVVAWFNLASGAVRSGHIGDAAVVSGSIASGSVGNFHISSGAVTSGEIGNAAVVSGSIASGSVGTFHIASGSITSDLIASGAIINADVADNAVTSGKIASGSIGTIHISSGGVQNVNIASGAVLSGNIASGQIGNFHLASGAVTSGEIGNAAVVSGSIASGTIGSVHIASGTYVSQTEVYSDANSGTKYISFAQGLSGTSSVFVNSGLAYLPSSGFLGIRASDPRAPLSVAAGIIGSSGLIVNEPGLLISPIQDGFAGRIVSGIINTMQIAMGGWYRGQEVGTAVYLGGYGPANISYSSRIVHFQDIGNSYGSRLALQTHFTGSATTWNAGIKIWETGAVTIGYSDDPVTGYGSSGDLLITGNFGAGTSTPGARIQVDTLNASSKGLIVKGFTSQTANLQEWQNSANFSVAYINSSGSLHVASGDIYVNGITVGKGGNNSQTNTGIGRIALSSNTSGSNNTAIGYFSLTNNTTGNENTAIGSLSLQNNATTNGQTAVGYLTLNLNSTGYNNTALGNQAMRLGTAAYNNVAVGDLALLNHNGYEAVAVGHEAGRYQANGSTALAGGNRSVYVGAYAKGFNDSDLNSIVIGYTAIGQGANTTVIGNSSTVSGTIYGSINFPFGIRIGTGGFGISSGGVFSGTLAPGTVTSGSIASGQISTFHIASGSITADLIASGAIITADIADNAVVSGKIASGVVAWFNLASGAVRSGHIGDNAVVSGSIASGQIWTFHFASGALIPDGGTF